MADKPAAAAGMYSSALPDKPLRRNTIDPEALSASEGSGQGVPACSNAWPEAQPLIGAVRNDSTTTVVYVSTRGPITHRVRELELQSGSFRVARIVRG